MVGSKDKLNQTYLYVMNAECLVRFLVHTSNVFDVLLHQQIFLLVYNHTNFNFFILFSSIFTALRKKFRTKEMFLFHTQTAPTVRNFPRYTSLKQNGKSKFSIRKITF